jgi:hypothetical protein
MIALPPFQRDDHLPKKGSNLAGNEREVTVSDLAGELIETHWRDGRTAGGGIRRCA